eukprot:TRINITY_DN38504_c0_g1_i1.p1 TRINITY_DN38504_c0_g1~~TRINITY_DN38504_c0_g1_i1.p1  ORF type:complete len:314 (+),score=51.70 TRINITY_DN38504_c0_g1_i1:152-1093(+)
MAAIPGMALGAPSMCSRQVSSPPSMSAAPSSQSMSNLCNSIRGVRLTATRQSDISVACQESLSRVPSGNSRGVVSMGAIEAGVGIMGNKVGMMTWFTPEGYAVPCTVIGLHPGNIVTQVKTPATDKYSAVQVGYRPGKEKNMTRPELGHLKKAFSGVGGAEGEEATEDDFLPLRHLTEFRLVSVDGFVPGQQLKVEEMFKEGDIVDVQGKSIGKGFQGGIKVYGFARGLMSHGSKSHRQLGSIGPGTTPGRVYPGKKMPRQLGNETVKIRKLKVIKVDTELGAIIVKGAIPGKAGNLVRITPAKIVGKNIPKN